MKRLIFYIGVFLLLAGLSVWCGVEVARVHRDALARVEEAVSMAEAGEWAAAREKLQQAGDIWYRQRGFLESVVSREDLLLAERSFAAAQAALEREKDDFFAAAAELRVMLENLVVTDLPTAGSLF